MYDCHHPHHLQGVGGFAKGNGNFVFTARKPRHPRESIFCHTGQYHDDDEDEDDDDDGDDDGDDDDDDVVRSTGDHKNDDGDGDNDNNGRRYSGDHT